MTLRGSAGLWSGLATAGPSCESAGELEEEGGRACCQLQSWAGHDNYRPRARDINKVNHNNIIAGSTQSLTHSSPVLSSLIT